MTTLCRECAAAVPASAARCPHCRSGRLVRHPELDRLAIAHLDCDAFYASVEKRDDPSLADRPVIVGGGRRGVVAACCYVARLYGVRSAMPMFKALEACPDAVVIRPNMRKYQEVGRQVRTLLRALTPLVEPLSIDEAFLDLSGTERLHGGAPARTLAMLARRIETEVGITSSIGLSYNKFLAKIASDLDKPRGFAVIGRADAQAFLDPQPVGLIWGVGAAFRRRLAADGIRTIGELRRVDERVLIGRYGVLGGRLARLARGVDGRAVEPRAAIKSISAETTFDRNLAEAAELQHRLWPLCEIVGRRLKDAALASEGVVVKLKTSDFRTRTRSQRLAAPTQLADVLYRTAAPLVAREADGTAFRLIGVGCVGLVDHALADPPDLLDDGRNRRARVERAIDAIRARLGDKAIGRGRGLPDKPRGGDS